MLIAIFLLPTLATAKGKIAWEVPYNACFAFMLVFNNNNNKNNRVFSIAEIITPNTSSKITALSQLSHPIKQTPHMSR